MLFFALAGAAQLLQPWPRAAAGPAVEEALPGPADGEAGVRVAVAAAPAAAAADEQLALPSAARPEAPARAFDPGGHGRRLRLLVCALWPTAFCLAAVATVLFWSGAATAGDARDFRLGSSIVKHAVVLVLLAVDAAAGRLPCAAAHLASPLVAAALYLCAAGAYTLATRGRGPYPWLDFRSGRTAATIGAGLAVLLVAFALLFAATRARDRAAAAWRGRAARGAEGA